MDIKEVLFYMFYKFFDKETSGSSIKNENILKKELTEELLKPIIRKFKKRNVYLPFIDNIQVADLTWYVINQ